jgi:hypothetical protein
MTIMTFSIRTELVHRLGEAIRSPAIWCLVAVLAFATRFLIADPTRLLDTLGDTDDATRLVTVREFLSGAPWYDTTLPRFGAPEPLLSHWSRLIDYPLAVLMAAFSFLTTPEHAELVTRFVWPLIVLLMILWFIIGEAEREMGWLGALLALGFAITCDSALFQFNVGRIDHHNVQILFAVSGLTLLARSLDDDRVCRASGACLGLGLAVGYEAIGLVIGALAILAFATVFERRFTLAVARILGAFASVLALAFIATIPPHRWLDVRCDALSLNLVMLAAAGAVGFWIMQRHASKLPSSGRLAVLALVGAMGLSVYAVGDPVCLKGPFAQVDPAARPIWLDLVQESRSLFWLATKNPIPAFAFALFATAGLAAQVIIWRQQRDAQTAMASAIIALSLPLAIWQIKLIPYTSWLAILPLTRLVLRLPSIGQISASTVRLGAFVLMSQVTLITLTSAALSGASLLGYEKPLELSEPSCFATKNVRPLAALEPGLVVADVDLGPYLVALTPHRVLAAPYHRLDKSIIEADAILNATLPEAERRLRALGADYVALCLPTSEDERRRQPEPKPGSLRAQLISNTVPAFLEASTIATIESSVHIWKVRRGTH